MKRVNKAVYPAIAVLMGYIVLILVGFMLTTGGTLVIYVQVGVSGATLLVSTIIFIAKKSTKMCGIVMLICASIAYAVIVIIGNSDDAFAYAFPILFAAIAYLNVKIIAVGNGIIVVKLMIKNNKENVQTIMDASDKQEESNKKITQTAERISELFDQAMELIDRLDRSVDTSNFAMTNIADSTENTADAIQKQIIMFQRALLIQFSIFQVRLICWH